MVNLALSRLVNDWALRMPNSYPIIILSRSASEPVYQSLANGCCHHQSPMIQSLTYITSLVPLYRCWCGSLSCAIICIFFTSLSIASWLTLFQTSEAEHCAVTDMWWADEDTFKPGTGTYVGCLPGRHVRVDLPPFAGVFGTFLDFPRLLQFLFQCIVAGIKSEWA